MRCHVLYIAEDAKAHLNLNLTFFPQTTPGMSPQRHVQSNVLRSVLLPTQEVTPDNLSVVAV
jgi:hypothetical protein